MERKTVRRWQLQDLLHHAREAGVTQSDYGDPHGDVLQAKIEPVDPKLKGAIADLDANEKTGLPECLTRTASTFMYRAIAAGLRRVRGAPPTLTWTLPITCSTQLKMTLEDLQLHHDDDRRYVTVTLRAQPTYSRRPAYDDVKVWIDEDQGKRLYFARCQAFFKDGEDEHYVAVRWYAQTASPPPGTVLELPALTLAPENRTDSYSILPVECIINGAVLILHRGHYWAVQSPREEYAYNRNELAFQE